MSAPSESPPPPSVARAQAIGHDLFFTLVSGILLFTAVSKTWPAGHGLHPTALHWVAWGVLAGIPLGFFLHALCVARGSCPPEE